MVVLKAVADSKNPKLNKKYLCCDECKELADIHFIFYISVFNFVQKLFSNIYPSMRPLILIIFIPLKSRLPLVKVASTAPSYPQKNLPSGSFAVNVYLSGYYCV